MNLLPPLTDFYTNPFRLLCPHPCMNAPSGYSVIMYSRFHPSRSAVYGPNRKGILRNELTDISIIIQHDY